MEQHSPGLERLVDVRRETEELASGFGGPSGPAEGPVWWQEGGYLLYPTAPNNFERGDELVDRRHRRYLSCLGMRMDRIDPVDGLWWFNRGNV